MAAAVLPYMTLLCLCATHINRHVSGLAPEAAAEVAARCT